MLAGPSGNKQTLFWVLAGLLVLLASKAWLHHKLETSNGGLRAEPQIESQNTAD